MTARSSFDGAQDGGLGVAMEGPRIPETSTDTEWDYDEEADVLYIAIGKPRPALGMDIGEGAILRYDEMRNEVVGITIMGVRHRLLEVLSARQ